MQWYNGRPSGGRGIVFRRNRSDLRGTRIPGWCLGCADNERLRITPRRRLRSRLALVENEVGGRDEQRPGGRFVLAWIVESPV